MIHSEQLSFMGMSRAGGRTQLSMQKWMVRMYRHRVSEYRQDKAAVGYPGDVSASSDGCHESGGGWFGHQAINLDTQDIP